MKEFDYVPKGVNVVNDGGVNEFVPTKFKGKVRIKIPTYKERIQLAQEMAISDLKKSADGSVDLKSGIDIAGKMLEKLSEMIVSIDLKFGKQSFKSLEELQYYKEGNDVVNELSHVIMHGLTLGES